MTLPAAPSTARSTRHAGADSVPLSALRAGQRAVVRQIAGGHAVAQRLASMGILAGRELEVLRSWGSVIVRIRDSRLAVGRGVAQRIFVELRPERKT